MLYLACSNGMKAGLPAVLSWIAKLPGQTKERLGNAKTWLRGKGNAAITGLKNGWEAVRESTFLSRVKKIASQSFNAIGDIKSKVTPKGRDIISGMRTGLNNNWSSLSGILSNIPGKDGKRNSKLIHSWPECYSDFCKWIFKHPYPYATYQLGLGRWIYKNR